MPVSDINPVSKPLQAFWLAVCCTLMLVLAVLPAPATAVTVSDLYSVEVPVSGTNSSALAQGYSEGLARVFVRVSGTRDVLDLDGVQALLADAESLLLSYQVLRGSNGDNRMSMAFGAVGVNQALASVDAPVWGANRPLTLAWIAVEENGVRRLVTEDSQGQAAAWSEAFSRAARERGLPVALPPSDVAGNRELLSDIWGQFAGSVRNASDGIERDALALVRVSRSGGQWRAGWIFEGDAFSGSESSVSAGTREGVADAVINRWAEMYADRYAVAAGEVGELPQVDIVLRGVGSVADYGNATQALEEFTPVVTAGASSVTGDQLTLRVAFSGELDQLKEYMALDARFVPAEEPSQKSSTTGEEEEAAASSEQAFESLYQVLYYHWRPEPVIGNNAGE
ncbi:DUF2066 domain-containing protein [Marinobacter piscensis]|uniref:DUF2066 domain-containing protein n=1 Tax=Marinobacter piscensis TaxID=1562308 RepID=UPI001FE7CB26|nr:DUF2066 domain-containing protein [Marinobacter piscensis]